MAREIILSQLNYQKHITNSLSTKNIESTKHKQSLLKKYFESKTNQRYDVQKIQPSKQQIEYGPRDKENSPISKVQSSCSNYSTKQERLQKDCSHYILKSTQDSQEFNKFIKSSSDNQKQQFFLKKNNNNEKRLSDPLHMTPLSSLIRQSQKKHSSMMEVKQQEQMEVKKFVISEQIEPKITSPVKACFFSLKDEQREQIRSISDDRIKCFTINKMPKKSTKMHTQGKNESINTMNKLYEYILDVEL